MIQNRIYRERIYREIMVDRTDRRGRTTCVRTKTTGSMGHWRDSSSGPDV